MRKEPDVGARDSRSASGQHAGSKGGHVEPSRRHRSKPSWMLPTEFGVPSEVLCQNADDWQRTVTLRIELMSSREAKFASVMSMMSSFLAAGVAIAQTIVKSKVNQDWLEEHERPSYFYVSLGLAAAMVCLELLALGLFTRRVLQARRAKRCWSFRRRRIATWVFVFGAVQLLSLSFWLSSMAYIVSTPCSWINLQGTILGGLQWTCLNVQLLIMVATSHAAAEYRGCCMQAQTKQQVLSSPQLSRSRAGCAASRMRLQ